MPRCVSHCVGGHVMTFKARFYRAGLIKYHLVIKCLTLKELIYINFINHAFIQ